MARREAEVRAGRATLVLLLALGALARSAPAADEPWETEVRAALKEQDRLLDEARRSQTTAHLVGRYQSRLDRAPTAMNHYLLARTLYYHKDVQGAASELDRVLQIEPRFWFARQSLAVLSLERNDLAAARASVEAALSQKPGETELLKLRARIQMEGKDLDGALATVGQLVSQDPGKDEYRRMEVALRMKKEDWSGVLRALEPIRARTPDDPAVRWYRAIALFESKQPGEAEKEVQLLLRVAPSDPGALDLLYRIQLQREDWAGAAKTLERLLPQIPDEGTRARAKEVLDRLRSGNPKGTPTAPAAPPEESPVQEWTRIVEQALDESSVVNRRAGMQRFFGLLTGEGKHPQEAVQVPLRILQRIHEDLEPDAEVRAWVMRILGLAGSRGHPHLAIYAAFALFDPESSVRRMAAEALGDIATPASLVYLRTWFLLLPARPDATEEDVREFNAGRLALTRVTHHEDVPAASGAWIDAAGLAAVQKGWQEWLRSPDGEAALVAGIQDLVRLGEVFPQRWVVELVSEPGLPVARAAYEALLQRSQGPPEGVTETALEKHMWPRFPRLDAKDLTERSLPGLRDAVDAWWGEWRSLKEAERLGTGTPDGPAPGAGK